MFFTYKNCYYYNKGPIPYHIISFFIFIIVAVECEAVFNHNKLSIFKFWLTLTIKLLFSLYIHSRSLLIIHKTSWNTHSEWSQRFMQLPLHNSYLWMTDKQCWLLLAQKKHLFYVSTDLFYILHQDEYIGRCICMYLHSYC